ncbi:hypothetical protein ILUMI_11953 [Ignelater luminosus]|uniref:Ribosomal protein eL8/eL30/eS12/Gadd45 domain-containing protein n=1 Tax=Ignelater luminosus TaxID=2038154 RepID=A0A8K0D0I6_IGNLU|nr:hypothetical protein ILUMI_11953 [Ignelater luminosus]
MDSLDKSCNQHVDRIKLKEERKLRNKEKKIAKKLEKQRDREQKELLLKLQLRNNNVTLITQDFADKVVGGTSAAVAFHRQESFSNVDFPELTSAGGKVKRHQFPTPYVEINDKKKLSKLELADFIYTPSTSTKQVKIASTPENYNGNPLDSDMPIRKRGKHKETPKPKSPSKLKRDILNELNDCEKIGNTSSTYLLLETALCNNIITEELDEAVKTFISGIVGLQEKLYNRDPIKGVAKRRYTVGLHEVKKYLHLNKVKIVIIAPDLKLTKRDGALYLAVKEIIDLAKANSVHYLFALKRKSIGVLTLKNIPVSCIAILNYEGLEDQFRNILKLLLLVRKEENLAASQTINNEVNIKFLNNLMDALKSK